MSSFKTLKNDVENNDVVFFQDLKKTFVHMKMLCPIHKQVWIPVYTFECVSVNNHQQIKPITWF